MVSSQHDPRVFPHVLTQGLAFQELHMSDTTRVDQVCLMCLVLAVWDLLYMVGDRYVAQKLSDGARLTSVSALRSALGSGENQENIFYYMTYELTAFQVFVRKSDRLSSI